MSTVCLTDPVTPRLRSNLLSRVWCTCAKLWPETPPPQVLLVHILTRFCTAVQHLETYWAILEKVKGSTLRLTKIDDEIYDHLCKDFPEFDPAETIDESKLKSPAGKKQWRDFMMAYENKVDDYSFGTMLRTSPKEEYTQHGTIFGESTPNSSHSSNG